MDKNVLHLTPGMRVLASHYVWWESPEWALEHPTVLLSNVMNLGGWEDFKLLRTEVNDNLLRQVLLEAPPGYFNYRSWDYWHIVLDQLPIPELPTRAFQ